MHGKIHAAAMMPVSVSPGTAEAEELQDVRDLIGEAANQFESDRAILRLIAEKQAEVLESHARTLISQHRCDEMFAARTVHDVLLSEAGKLRRQAEGAK